MRAVYTIILFLPNILYTVYRFILVHVSKLRLKTLPKGIHLKGRAKGTGTF